MMQKMPMYLILSSVLPMLSSSVFIAPVNIHMLSLQEKITAKLQFFREEQDAWEQCRKTE